MADRYNVRNVAQKEIYDSYMGIMRISPNKYYSKDTDDTTLMLETLVDINGAFKEDDDTTDNCNEVKVQVSDSDGNLLPIFFIPKAFRTNVLIRKDGVFTNELKDLINITTFSDSQILVTNNLIVRSTINLINPVEKKSKVVIISGCNPKSTTNTISGDNIKILSYPIENPNDDKFFNLRNKHDLFDPNSTIPRHEQMETNLLKKNLDWYKKIINEYKEKHNGEDPQVKINGKFINIFNDNNEEVPVLYTRDYVLGHYEGHALSKNDFSEVKEKWIGEDGAAGKISKADITKLSWIRFDNLVWDALDEVLSGKVRHVNGRYNDLGESGEKSYSIANTLFGKLGDVTLSNDKTLWDKDTAPLLGNGVQEGMIMYHAMPFHRYWFHRCRQIIYNMERWETLYAQKNNNNKPNNWSQYTGIINDVQEIKDAKASGLITGTCKASITPHHSLVKDFLLCNGKEASFLNFPNINLSNYNLFKINNPGKEVEIDDTTKCFPERNKEDDTSQTWTSGTYKALCETSNENSKIKLPNLFSFDEAYPRFIRSFDWEINDDVNTTVNFGETTTYSSEDWKDPTRIILHSDKQESVSVLQKDILGKKLSIDIKKPFKTYGLHYFNFDILSPKPKHRHYLFSSVSGGNDSKNTSFYTKTLYEYGYSSLSYKATPLNGGLPSGNFNFSTTTWGYDWLDYCINLNRTHFQAFTPIPNLGMMLWNGDIYTGSTKGSLTAIENGTTNFGFINAQNQQYMFDSNFKLSKTVNNVSLQNVSTVDYNNLNIVRTQRFKRKQQSIKLNESESMIPISSQGFARYQIITNHKWKRKKSWGSRATGRKWDTEYGTSIINNVGGYQLKSFTGSGEKIGWSCYTSLPYENTEYLGYGNPNLISDDYLDLNYNSHNKTKNPADYYINHNVTDKWKQTNVVRNKKVFYGGKKIDANIESPYPSYMNLIPLIRL